MCVWLINKSPLQLMGQMLLACFSKVNSCDAMSRHDTNGRTWPWAMCSHIFLKRSKPLARLLGTKQSCKNSYTILERPPNERLGKRVKIKINASLSKTKVVFKWKSSTKGGRSTSTNGWRWRRVAMVWTNGVVGVLGTNVHTIQTYSPTWASVCAQHNCVNAVE